MEQHCQHAVCKLQSVLSSFSFQSSFTLLSLVIHQRECRHVTLVLTPPVSKLVLQVQTAFCPCNFLQKKRASAVTVKTRRSLTGQACYFETSSGCRSLATISSGLFLFIFSLSAWPIVVLSRVQGWTVWRYAIGGKIAATVYCLLISCARSSTMSSFHGLCFRFTFFFSF